MLAETFHTCDLVLMVRPAAAGIAAQSAALLDEFDRAVARLDEAGLLVLVLDDKDGSAFSSALFPSRWVSLHGDGAAILYPLASERQRADRAPDALFALLEAAGRDVGYIIDLTALEDNGEYLEGTASLVLDRMGSRAFASRSEKTTDLAVSVFEEAGGWPVHLFEAFGPDGQPIAHTARCLSLGARFAVACLEAVAEDDRAPLVEALEDSRREIIEVSFAQMAAHACEILEVRDRYDAVVLLMSEGAKAAFTPAQLKRLERLSGRIVTVPIPEIERLGGASLKSMLVEVALGYGDDDDEDEGVED